MEFEPKTTSLQEVSTVPKTYLCYITKASNGNIDKIQSYYYSGTDLYYRIQCKNCKATFNWSHANNFDKPFGIDIDVLEKFCKSHKHIPVYDAGKSYEASQEFVAKKPDYYAGQYKDYTTYDDLVSNKNSLDIEQLKQLDKALNQVPAVFGIQMGNYGSKNYLEPEQLKKIWQWSNFKVDMQVRVYNGSVNAVRLFCNECKQEQGLNWYQVQTGNYSIWDSIQEWCEGHKDCGQAVCTIAGQKGRKFKHAG